MKDASVQICTESECTEWQDLTRKRISKAMKDASVQICTESECTEWQDLTRKKPMISLSDARVRRHKPSGLGSMLARSAVRIWKLVFRPGMVPEPKHGILSPIVHCIPFVQDVPTSFMVIRCRHLCVIANLKARFSVPVSIAARWAASIPWLRPPIFVRRPCRHVTPTRIAAQMCTFYVSVLV
jgi:hypothetical protein